MLRRELIKLIGSAATAWPLKARAQKPMPVIGYLSTGSPESDDFRLAAFRQGLNEAGYVEGQNVAIEYVGRRANMVNCRPWRPIWFVVR